MTMNHKLQLTCGCLLGVLSAVPCATAANPLRVFIRDVRKDLSAAKAKDHEVKQRAKKLATEGKLKPAEEQAALKKLRIEALTERERQVLQKGISNFEFHYLGSAKILGSIGKGFAESMADLKQLHK